MGSRSELPREELQEDPTAGLSPSIIEVATSKGKVAMVELLGKALTAMDKAKEAAAASRWARR
jgi:hypothetical protein